MKQFLLQFNANSKGTIMLSYNATGTLVKMDIALEPDAAVVYFLRYIPAKLAELEKYRKLKQCRVTPVARDLSFKAFWNAFENKVGHKARAEKLWNSLSDIERARALDYIPRYNQFLFANPGVQKLYPETYLNQKRYDNE